MKEIIHSLLSTEVKPEDVMSLRYASTYPNFQDKMLGSVWKNSNKTNFFKYILLQIWTL